MEAQVGVNMNVGVESMSAWALIGTSTWKVNVDLEKVGVSWNVDVERERRRGKQTSPRTSNVRVDTKRRRESASRCS